MKALTTILDVGANKGDFSKFILENCENVSIFAFEPNWKVCGERLEILSNSYPQNFQCSFVALSQETGKSLLHGSNLMNGQLGSLLPLNTSSSGWDFHKDIVGETNNIFITEVSTESVQDAVTRIGVQSIDFLKIDTQGTDVAILEQFFKYLNVKSGVIEVDIGDYSSGQRYLTNNNDINTLISILNSNSRIITKIIPNNNRQDELNIFFSDSYDTYNQILRELKFSRNPIFAKYWNIQGIGIVDQDSTVVMTGRLFRKVLTSVLHPINSYKSLLIKLTK